MFAPAQMYEVNIFILEGDVEKVALALARLSAVQLADAEALEEWAGEGTGRWAGLASIYATQERRLLDLLQALQIAESGIPPPCLEPGNDVARIEEVLQEAERVVQDWRHRKEAADRQARRLRLVREQIRLLAPLDVPVERLRQLRYLHLTVGTIPSANLARLQTALFRIAFVIIPVYAYDDRTLIFAASTHEHAPILDRALRSAFLEPLDPPQDVTGSPAQALTQLEERLEATQGALTELEAERERLAQTWGPSLLALWQQARTDAALADAIRRFGRHGQIYLVVGWVPAHALNQVIQTVQDVTEGRATIETLEPDRVRPRRVPTLLRNPRFLRPFERIVATFGLPAYNEVDPTPLLALTFVLMYGMMFGDVGHGLLLALIGLWLSRSRGSLARMGPVLTASGLSAATFGLLYGSLFGLETVLPHLWLRPREDMLDLLLTSVVAGIVLLNVGFLLHLVTAWRAREVPRLLFDKNGLAGIWLYWALFGGALARLRAVPLPGLLWLLLVLVPAALIFLHEPLGRAVTGHRPWLEGNWGPYAVESIFELFEALISYLSNSLSFVRLGAFAVAHVGLSQVIFLLAGPRTGSVGWWLVVALGTVIILAFEGLIVGIQTLRLEYYEFFGKFFRGAGHAFIPLRLPETTEA
ncbi:MAG: hypothetical protein M5U01_42685 [Ardenticatenaceae bacterium]|nr:hypothetical protein [Ardenticatenaceae bacterium]HBY95383.1 hypothetical protein [Chloroflexota bacterium]